MKKKSDTTRGEKTRASVIKEMAQPRMSLSASEEELNLVKRRIALVNRAKSKLHSNPVPLPQRPR